MVAELLRRAGGTVTLVDVSDKLPELKRRPGLHTWRVFDSAMKVRGEGREGGREGGKEE